MLAFAVVVIGGLGSIGGALAGALIVGFSRATAVHLLPQVELFVIFGVMSLVLVVRPRGCFSAGPSREKSERCPAIARGIRRGIRRGIGRCSG